MHFAYLFGIIVMDVDQDGGVEQKKKDATTTLLDVVKAAETDAAADAGGAHTQLGHAPRGVPRGDRSVDPPRPVTREPRRGTAREEQESTVWG